jgi:predicted O-methyltransferase YrrM
MTFDYTQQTLLSSSSEIYYWSGEVKEIVMADWEHDLMSASAAYVCSNGGDILEIGFGMGISAGYIQSHSVTSHTICENHPTLIAKAEAWAADRPNVTIVSQSWYDALSSLGVYDGIFYDTWSDNNWIHFSASLAPISKAGTLVTWFNNRYEAANDLGIEVSEYEAISVTPPDNNYFTNTTYYLPKCHL